MAANDELEKLLGKVFDSVREGLQERIEPDDYARRRRDFIFHMTDWTSDLQQLTDLYNHPEGREDRSASVLLIGFLYHVIPHLNTAGRLLLDEIMDPFADGPNKGGGEK